MLKKFVVIEIFFSQPIGLYLGTYIQCCLVMLCCSFSRLVVLPWQTYYSTDYSGGCHYQPSIQYISVYVSHIWGMSVGTVVCNKLPIVVHLNLIRQLKYIDSSQAEYLWGLVSYRLKKFGFQILIYILHSATSPQFSSVKRSWNLSDSQCKTQKGNYSSSNLT